MERLADLGKAIAQLRSLRGLSIFECASRIGTTPEALAAAEQGDIDLAALEGLARFYALDEAELREGMVMPVEGAAGSTVFLLHGAYQDFDARDLGVLDLALRAARSVTALAPPADAGARLQRRLQFIPVEPAGPLPADAARQGHRLARRFRAKLKLGGEPLGDMRSLLEEQLGIAVLVDEIISDDLRAASILDAHRAAAAAVLSSNDSEREKNPSLARVYLAHELSHLLFDPGAPGSVRVALDDRASGRSEPSSNPIALLESRAKGFAAELLIPHEGVRALIGARAAPVSSLTEARSVVAKVRDHFTTPWEIATSHLTNLNVIQRELRLDLLRDKQAASQPRHTTSLPVSAGTSRLLGDLLAAQSTPAVESMSIAAEIATHPPWYVSEVQRAKIAAMDSLTSGVIEDTLRSVAAGRPIEATDLLGQHFDDLFLAGEFDVARRALAKLDARRLPPGVLTAVLVVSAHARDELGDARSDFLGRVRAALEDTWEFTPKAIEAVVRRLR